MDHESSKTTHECETPVVQEGPVETQDRGLFDFLGKKKEGEETKQEGVMAAEFEEKVKVEEPKEEEEKEKEKKHGLLEKLHRSGSSSSSSSDEEEGKDEEKKDKRKEKKDKKKEKEEEKRHEEDTTVPVEKWEEPGAPADEKKGFIDKIKDRLPGGQKKADEVPSPPPAECPAAEPPCHEGSPKEKKGLLEKIKEKLPGYHPKSDEEKEKDCH
ncbi:dehydrin ERD14 [Rhodamnia argentea]|uniref:Dehydrin ERD14 n=1 Tax=Rhodamnia argentea TaxID=178133 RepID=A0A8B8NXK6_9MYRT|nr:dehydrin ERD14 [Rhodamnia argentea]